MGASADAAALMDRIYGSQRHIYDVTRRYYLLGRDRLVADLAPQPGHRVLEIGCGTGRNLLHAARHHPQAEFFGLDISRAMLETAASSIRRAGATGHIRLRCADATKFEPEALFGVARFDRVFIAYSLSMIPDWQSVLDRALAALAPGGELHVVDFGGQRQLPVWFRRALRAWLLRFHVRPRDGLEAALKQAAAARGATLEHSRPFRDYAQRAVLRLPG